MVHALTTERDTAEGQVLGPDGAQRGSARHPPPANQNLLTTP